MKFLPYEPSKREEWDNFVLSHPEAGFGHLSSNFLLDNELSQSRNHSVMMYEDSMRLIGVLPLREIHSVMQRFFKLRTLTSTAGPLFRSHFAPPERSRLLDSLIDHVGSLADNLDVDRISITYPSFIDGQLAIAQLGYLPLRKHHFVESNMLGTYLDLNSSEADLFATFTCECRRNIRKADKAGVQVVEIHNRQEWLDCEPLSEQTLGYQKFSARAMEVVWDEFVAGGHARVYAARQKNRIVSVEAMQTFNRCAYFWIAFNARPFVEGAHHCLIWHCIRRAKELGITSFLLGTMEYSDDSKTQGISDFKKRFGGTPYYVLGGTLIRKRLKYHSLQMLTELARPVLPAIRELAQRLSN